MAKKPNSITENQERAITATGKNILVSASAGAGKTFVMIERIIKLITEKGVDISNILAVTYTNLAASEMKQKLVKAVIKRINEGKDIERMKKTLEEIPTADISTIHSFCLNLLKTYFYIAGVDPDFAIADEPKRKELSTIAINSVFNDFYTAKDPDFLKLVRIYRSGRTDGTLKSIILELYTDSISEENPEKFLLSAADGVKEETYAFYENFLLNHLKNKAKAKGADLKLHEEDLLLLNPADPLSQGLARNISELKFKQSAIQNANTLDELRNALLIGLSDICRITTKDEAVIQVKSEIQTFKSAFKKHCDELVKIIPADRDGDLKAYLATRSTISALAKLTLAYAEKFGKLKDKDGVMDFSDLETKTVKLLKSNPEVLAAVRDKYKFVFADEYQDVNGVQEEILSLISQDNLFMVGDIKQSIYAFRGCNPNIFANKYADYDSKKTGYAIPLDKNFRSSDGVLSAVNNVFSDVITKEHGGVDYKNNPMLRGGLFAEGYGSSTLHLIELEKADKRPISGLYNLVKDATAVDEEDDFYEGALVAQIIKSELTEEIWDEKDEVMRPVKLSDIAVLTRTATGYTDEVVKRLVREGIPVVCESKVNILNYPEIKLLVDLVKLICFYADDPPLVAVLKSAIGNFTLGELAKIRRFALDLVAAEKQANPQDKTKITIPSFLESIEKYAELGDDEVIKNKLAAFDEYFSKIRVLAEFMGAGELIAKIMRDTGLDYQIASMPLGKIRLARVERFIAESTPQGKALTVNEFLDKINSADGFTATSEVAGTGAVKVMSMHASKGLEYPIVIIPGLHKMFNDKDDKKQVLFSRKNGLAVYHYDEDNRTKISTLANFFFKQTAAIERANEEARVFYVAMTRAKAKLHLISTREILPSRNDEDFIFYKHFSDFLSLKDMPTVTYPSSTLKASGNDFTDSVILDGGRQSLIDLISNNLNFVYPHQVDIGLPVKSSVTAVNARNNEVGSLAISKKTEHFADEIAETIENGEPSSDIALTGTAYHRFLELCDFYDKNANNQLIGLLNANLIEKHLAQKLQVDTLEKILALPVWDMIKGYELYKEQPFMTHFTARELYGEDSDAKILVQGIIDLLAVKDGKVILIDYKFSDHSPERLKADYHTQLWLYKKAIEKCLGLSVEKAFVLALKTGALVEI